MARWSKLVCPRILVLAGACAGITACASLAAGLVAYPADNPVIGAWSRNAAACTRPELTFSRDRLEIHIDADGTPVRFSYAGIRYGFDAGRIAVTLGSNHPYGKTASKHVLQFRQEGRDGISLLGVNAMDTDFIRCSY